MQDSLIKCVYLRRYSLIKCDREVEYSLIKCDLKIWIMERLAINELLKWKNKQYRKPLIIEGARQVGKTWLVKEFARQNYRQLAYVNFEEMKILQNLFEQDFNIPRILTAIGAATNVTCTEGETLIFLDEIQAAPHAVTSLKYFAENALGYHVIAAGSLLGIELHQGESFPVGKVEFLSLYPMNFIEFVMAMGEKNLAQLLLTKDWNMISMFAPKFQELLKYYYYVGGMPEAVLSFSQNRDWKEVRAIQKDILSSYQRDMSKHAPSEIIPRITDLWKSLPAQLSKENRKFIYGVVREGARAREYELALKWLLDAGLIYKVYNVKAPRLPLASYEDRAAFKIFVLDVGLLGAMSNLKATTIVDGNSIFTEFKGALTEQYVLQQLILRYEPYYYAKTNSTQEIDFLLQDEEDEIVPLEVKAETNVKAKSLRQFVADNQSKKTYRISMNDYQQEDWVTNVPLYAVNGLEI